MSEPSDALERVRDSARAELRRLEDEFRRSNSELIQAAGYSRGWQEQMQARMLRLERQLDSLQLLLIERGLPTPKDNKLKAPASSTPAPAAPPNEPR